MPRRLVSSGSSFERDIGYSRAVVVGNQVFVSGTTGFDYSNMTISDDVATQAAQCVRNIEAALREAKPVPAARRVGTRSRPSTPAAARGSVSRALLEIDRWQPVTNAGHSIMTATIRAAERPLDRAGFWLPCALSSRVLIREPVTS
jgi:hypothetical protein